MNKITPNLWFDTQAEDAARFYTSIFPNSRITNTTRYSDEGREIHGMEEGAVMTVDFVLDDTPFVALNGGPHFKFNESISFVVDCKTQEEVDFYWERLGDGGDPSAQACGWLKDKFGLSWQIVPSVLNEMLLDGDPIKVRRVTQAFLQMKKFDIDALKRAFSG